MANGKRVWVASRWTKHVAESVKFIYDMPQAVNIRELAIAATRQDS